MVFVICEIGVNWAGLKDVAFDMIAQAKKTGCDAVKMQMFSKAEIKNSIFYPQLESMILKPDSPLDPKIFKEYAETVVGIKWFATPFNLRALDYLNVIGVEYIKIREADSGRADLVDAALATSKKIFISSYETVTDPKLLFNPNVKILFCIPHYPPKIDELHRLKENLEGYFQGYSNHYPEVWPSILACAYGAEVIEIHAKHFAVEKALDEPVSLSFNQIAELVKAIRHIETLGLAHAER